MLVAGACCIRYPCIIRKDDFFGIKEFFDLIKEKLEDKVKLEKKKQEAMMARSTESVDEFENLFDLEMSDTESETDKNCEGESGFSDIGDENE